MNAGNNVVTFEQGADFFYKRAMSRRDDGNTLEALALFRRACSIEPINLAYAVEYAQTYADIGFFDLSNDILTPFFNEDVDLTADFYYLVGFNYTALQAFGLAVHCFNKYLELTGESEDFEGTEVLFDILDNNDFADLAEDFDEKTAMLQEAISHNMELVVSGQVDKALLNLQKLKATGKFDNSYELDNTIAMAHFCRNEHQKALEICDGILRQDPQNIQVLCQKILIYSAMELPEKASDTLKLMASFNITQTSSNIKVGLMYCELGRCEEGLKYFMAALASEPFDVNTLHFTAFANYNIGQYAKALELWSKIQKLMPMSYVASYYATCAQNKLIDNEKDFELSIYFQVPNPDLYKTMTNAVCSNEFGKEEKLKILAWACKNGDENICSMAAGMMLSADFEGAKRILSAMMLSPETSTEHIVSILDALEAIDERVYCIATENGIEKITASELASAEAHMETAAFFGKVTILLRASTFDRDIDEDVVTQILEQWEKFEAMSVFMNLQSVDKDERAFAAAAEYYVRGKMLGKTTQQKIADEYGVSVYKLRKMYNIIKETGQIFTNLGKELNLDDDTLREMLSGVDEDHPLLSGLMPELGGSDDD